MMVSERIRKDLKKAVEKALGVVIEDIRLEHPADLRHGDYSSNLALAKLEEVQSSKSKVQSPQKLAQCIVDRFPETDYLEKVEVAEPGFINFWLSKEWLARELSRVLEEGERYGSSDILKGKKILLEHTSPNPQTTIMLGHLRNNFLGMAVANVLEFSGARVIRDCVVNDRGVHICRAIWGYLVFANKGSGLLKPDLLGFRDISDSQIRELIAGVDWRQLLEGWVEDPSGWLVPEDLDLKPDHANLIWYVLGSRAYKLSELVKADVGDILVAWEAEDGNVWQIWRQILGWSDKGYQETYARVGSVHDWVWRESDYYKEGKKIVEEGLKEGIFRRSKGAVVTNLADYGLPDAVVVRSDGTALYMTQDLALTRLKTRKFPSDLYIWVIGAEQTLYFKQLFAVAEQLGIERRENLFHLGYALINFKGGRKMSTRRGDVVMADEILDELQGRAREIIETSNQELRGEVTLEYVGELSESVALGAIKYSLLKFGRERTISFDINESLALEGNSAPYLQYTYARAQSVLRKAASDNGVAARFTGRGFPVKLATLRYGAGKSAITAEERAILRTFYKFPEVVFEVAETYSPNLICNFLFDLAQKYNLFYSRCSILKAETEVQKDFRLALTAAAAQILKNGLRLLGIEVLERM